MRYLIVMAMLLGACAPETVNHQTGSGDDPDAGYEGPTDVVQPGEQSEALTRCDVWHTNFEGDFLHYFYPYPEGDDAFIPGTSCSVGSTTTGHLDYVCTGRGNVDKYEIVRLLSNGFLSAGYMEVQSYRWNSISARWVKRGSWTDAAPYICSCSQSPKCRFWGLVF